MSGFLGLSSQLFAIASISSSPNMSGGLKIHAPWHLSAIGPPRAGKSLVLMRLAPWGGNLVRGGGKGSRHTPLSPAFPACTSPG